MEQIQSREQLKIMSNQLIQVPRAQSQVEFCLPDGRSELFTLNSTGPVEFIFEEPVLHENGDTTIDLEILKFEVETTSQILWPGEKVTMGGGRNITQEALPIKGRVHIPEDKELQDGVESVQDVYLHITTPIGTLHNVEGISMKGLITGVPPLNATFRSDSETTLFDQNMEPFMAVKICGSATADY